MYETRWHPQWNLASTVYRKPSLTPITCYREKNSMLAFMKLHLERKLPIYFRKAVCHHHFSILYNIGSLSVAHCQGQHISPEDISRFEEVLYNDVVAWHQYFYTTLGKLRFTLKIKYCKSKAMPINIHQHHNPTSSEQNTLATMIGKGNVLRNCETNADSHRWIHTTTPGNNIVCHSLVGSYWNLCKYKWQSSI